MQPQFYYQGKTYSIGNQLTILVIERDQLIDVVIYLSRAGTPTRIVTAYQQLITEIADTIRSQEAMLIYMKADEIINYNYN